MGNTGSHPMLAQHITNSQRAALCTSKPCKVAFHEVTHRGMAESSTVQGAVQQEGLPPQHDKHSRRLGPACSGTLQRTVQSKTCHLAKLPVPALHYSITLTHQSLWPLVLPRHHMGTCCQHFGKAEPRAGMAPQSSNGTPCTAEAPAQCTSVPAFLGQLIFGGTTGSTGDLDAKFAETATTTHPKFAFL